MLSKILNNKFALIGVAAVVVVLIIVLFQFVNLKNISDMPEENSSNEKIGFSIDNFKTVFYGKIMEGGIDQQIVMEIKTLLETKKGEFVFTYDLKLDYNLVLEDKKGVIDNNNKTIIFNPNKNDPKEIEITEKLGSPKFKVSGINKIIITGNRWEISEM